MILTGTVIKEVGQNYTIEWNKDTFTVSILFKGRCKASYSFDKYYKAVNFYARFKKVKNIKEFLES